MIRKLLSISFWALMVCPPLYSAHGEESALLQAPSRTLDCSMREIYMEFPKDVDCFMQMLSEGEWYYRLRTNAFVFEWGDELMDEGGFYTSRRNHQVIGVGGSVVYKSAYVDGFGFTVGLYASRSFGSLSNADVIFDKSGKDMLSRYDLLSYGRRYMFTFAQAYGEYRSGMTTFKIGRQIFESTLLKSNDTKMIPNTFEGVSWYANGLLENTVIKGGVFWKQKLRDHTRFHHVLAYGDDPNDPYALYSQNDDSAMHRGLKLSVLRSNGILDRLWVLELKSRLFDSFQALFDITAVPGLLYTTTLQAQGQHDVGDLHVVPALRLMRQFDDGAGIIGGANLKENTIGYRDPQSLDAFLWALRVDIVEDAWKLRLAYSDVADMGDFVAPWRGFPTGGFTRAMGQYNWQSDTDTTMLQFDYDFEKAGLLQGLKTVIRYGVQNFDDIKPGVPADSRVLTLDIFKDIASVPGMKLRVRYGDISGDKNVIAFDGTLKPDPSYQEARFEVNYLF